MQKDIQAKPPLITITYRSCHRITAEALVVVVVVEEEESINQQRRRLQTVHQKGRPNSHIAKRILEDCLGLFRPSPI